MSILWRFAWKITNGFMDAIGTKVAMGIEMAMGVAMLLVAATAPAFASEEIPVEEPPKWQEKGYGYDNGFYTQSAGGRFKLKTNGLLQVRFQSDFPDRGQSQSRFSVPRARLVFQGHAFSRKIRFLVMPDFGKGDARLIDYYLDLILVRKALHLWVGQGKKPFGRQFLSGAALLEFGDRAITGRAFGVGHDIGVMLHNNFKKAEGIEWAVGVFNGTGIDGQLSAVVGGDGVATETSDTNVPSDFRPELVARLGYNAGGNDGYSEGDLIGGPFRWALAAAARSRLDAPHDGFSDTAVELDMSLKGLGFAFTTGNYVLWESPLGSDGPSDQSYMRWGTENQLSYTLAAKHSLPVRWAFIDPKGANNNQHELLVGYTLYVIEHRFQWHIYGGAVFSDVTSDGNTDAVDSLIRTQLQLAF